MSPPLNSDSVPQFFNILKFATTSYYDDETQLNSVLLQGLSFGKNFRCNSKSVREDEHKTFYNDDSYHFDDSYDSM